MGIITTGINGQDGSYLAEYLLSLGYEVHGTVRRNSTSENQSARLKPAIETGNNFAKTNIFTHYGDLSDQGSIERLLEEIRPDEIYNIAAQSHVRVSFDIPQYTVQTNAIGVLNVLEAYKRTCPTAKFYQASSSEMFGLTVEDDGFHAMLNHDVADDFVVSTMKTHSVREMCDLVFKYLDLDYKDYIEQNPKFMRPEELPYLKGDSTKIRETLKWKPKYTFESMMHEMCDHWMDILQGKESLR